MPHFFFIKEKASALLLACLPACLLFIHSFDFQCFNNKKVFFLCMCVCVFPNFFWRLICFLKSSYHHYHHYYYCFVYILYILLFIHMKWFIDNNNNATTTTTTTNIIISIVPLFIPIYLFLSMMISYIRRIDDSSLRFIIKFLPTILLHNVTNINVISIT